MPASGSSVVLAAGVPTNSDTSTKSVRVKTIAATIAKPDEPARIESEFRVRSCAEAAIAAGVEVGSGKWDMQGEGEHGDGWMDESWGASEREGA